MSDPLASGIEQLWERSRRTVEQRVNTIERWAAAVLDGTADDELLRQARRDAHQLAGSLAILGLGVASDVARALDRALRPEPWCGDAREILTQVVRLKRALRSPGARPAGASEPAAPVRPVETSRPETADRLRGAGASLDRSASPPGPSVPARVLLADDDLIARVIETGLGLDGHTIVRVADGEAALKFAREQSFDLVLLDLQMPGVDGLEVCRVLRADARTAALPILLLTAQSDDSHVQAGFASGATDYLTKPFGVAQLRSRVREWLARAPR